MTHPEEPFLYPNYLALKLAILNRCSPERMVSALKEYFRFGETRKRGPKPKFTATEIADMKLLVESGLSYNYVANKYGLNRGDNLYQLFRRNDMLPERRKANEI